MPRCIPILLALATLALAGRKPAPLMTGKVLDSQAIKTRAGITPTVEALPTIRDTQLLILGIDFAYVIEDTRVSGATSLAGIAERAVSNRHHGCRFIVGDNIQYWQEKGFLHVYDVDGKECKVEILRQERLKPTDAK
jgi:hypothetical protein